MYNRIFAGAFALTGCLIFNLPTLLGQGALTIRVLAAFDYPGQGNSTTVDGINDAGDVVGYFEDGTGAIRGFRRFADGTFSVPIVEPDDMGNVTVPTDINNLGDICGYYFNGTDVYHPYHGFFLFGANFVDYVTSGADTYISGMNDARDFCATLDYTYLREGFLALGQGGMLYFNIGDNADANALNSHTGIVGNHDDSTGGVHGYVRGTEFTSARIHSPIDYPGAIQTYLFGLNDGGRVIVGKYVDSAGGTHGLVFNKPDSFTSFDYPGAVETSLNAINDYKIVAGYYADSAGAHHGFIAKIIESH